MRYDLFWYVSEENGFSEEEERLDTLLEIVHFKLTVTHDNSIKQGYTVKSNILITAMTTTEPSVTKSRVQQNQFSSVTTLYQCLKKARYDANVKQYRKTGKFRSCAPFLFHISLERTCPTNPV